MAHGHGFFSRLLNLWRGIWGAKLSDVEVRNAEAVYHNAIRQRAGQHNRLKDAVGRLVYLRNRLEADIQQRQRDRQMVEQSLAKLVGEDDDRALALIRKRRAIAVEIERLQGEHERITIQAEAAKQGLREVGDSIRRLKQERTEMLARKANALARIEVADILERSTSDLSTTNQALENVREAITRLEYRAELEVNDDFELNGELSLAELRRSFEDEEDLAELAVLKVRLSQKPAAALPSPRPSRAVNAESQTVGGVA